MGSVLSRHNKNILSRKEDQYGCNCRNKAECPLDNNCLTPRIIYQADVLTNLNDSKKFYIGLADTAFKERYRKEHGKEHGTLKIYLEVKKERNRVYHSLESSKSCQRFN